MIGRHYRAVVADWSAIKALIVFRRLLARERGAYWTFCFFIGDRYLIGASPERHVIVHGGDVRMNPISGRFRVAATSSQMIESANSSVVLRHDRRVPQKSPRHVSGRLGTHDDEVNVSSTSHTSSGGTSSR